MDCLELIRAARLKGLSLEVVGDVLKVRGPKRFSGMVERLIANKTEVISALAMPQATSPKFDIQSRGDGDKTMETLGLAEVLPPGSRIPDCGSLHVHPEK
jgi:hypothetical protein